MNSAQEGRLELSAGADSLDSLIESSCQSSGTDGQESNLDCHPFLYQRCHPLGFGATLKFKKENLAKCNNAISEHQVESASLRVTPRSRTRPIVKMKSNRTKTSYCRNSGASPPPSPIASILAISICCLISLQYWTISCADELELAPNPVRITIQPNDLIAIEGESAELNCDAEGRPEPSIEWYHNGQLIKSSTNSRTTMGGSIQFLDIRPNISPSSSSSFSAIKQQNRQHQQLQQSDAGIYHCVAKNQFGEARSRNATLQVAYIKEQFWAAPEDKLAIIGDTVMFECLPQAWPEPTIQWRRNGRPIEPARLTSDGSKKYTIQRIARTTPATTTQDLNMPAASGEANKAKSVGPPLSRTGGEQELVDVIGSQLVIQKVDKDDEGKYSCLVETKGSHRLIERESQSAQLIASVRPYFIEAPEHKSVQVGGQVQMRCRMGGDPEPVISWRRQNGQSLSDKTTIDPSDKTLVISEVRISDQGVYICEGENNAGSSRAMAQVIVNSRPKFNVQPTDQTVELGSRVQMKCSGDASPPPMMYWYKEGHRQLMFPPSTSSKYSQVSQQQTNWPQVAALTTNSDISPATNRLFSMPISSMEHLASQSNYFGNRIYVDSQGTLNIINATSSDSGYWACALISSVGSVMAKAKLTVKQPLNQPGSASTPDYFSDPLQQARLGGLTMFSGTSGKYDLLPPPVIKMGSPNQTVPTNTSINLHCDVVSQVAYKIQWFFDSQPLIEDPPRILTLENGNLGINDLRTSDSGVYTCVVTAANDQNMPLASPYEPLDASMLTSAPPVQQSTAHSCTLKVALPKTSNLQFFKMDIQACPTSPGIPYFVTTNGMDAVTIAWAPPAESGNFPIKQYIVEHYDSSQEHLGWKEIHRVNGKESLLIDGLSPDGSHFFVVRATNSYGVGPSSAIAGPIRTHQGELRYQLEQQRRRNPMGLEFADTRLDANQARDRLMTVTTNLISLTPVGSNSIRLLWSAHSAGNSSFAPLNSMAMGDFLEGYSIRYRAVGIGESLIGRDPLLGLNLNQFDNKGPSSLPLVTSYVEEEDISISPRVKRDLTDFYDNSQEFNEVRITDHNVEHYTINGLRPFTTYQFFVVPYFKDVDGIPSNILTAQTNEDRPSVAPSVPVILPINNTAVRLMWPHISNLYANGIIRGYYIRINSSDILNSLTTDGRQNMMSIAPKVLTLPVESLFVAPPVPPTASEARNPMKPVAMYDLSNLTYKSFYSIQVAGFTNPDLGPGPWSETKNFVMDPRKIKSNGIELDGIQTFLQTAPNSLDDQFGRSHELSGFYIILLVILLFVALISASGYILYRRNNQQVITWKKTISEHFANKFYMPSDVDHHHRGPDAIQQNIYDHQHNLIYSAGSAHIPQHPTPNQSIWAQGNNNGTGCINSSATGSLSSHGGLVPVSNDPNSTRDKANNDQILLLNNNKDANSRFPRAVNGGVFCSADPSRTLNQSAGNHQIIHHGGDYYSVINTVGEYEELDLRQRNNMQIASANVLERHLTGSSNSDTSCPSSVTRLLPNQNYNRDLLNRSSIDNQQRHEMILQQQVGCNGDIKQPFLTVISPNDASKFQQPKPPLAPYATTNLIHQMAQQQPQQTNIFTNPQVNLMNQTRQQQNFMMQNGGSAMDDSSKILMSQQMNGANGHNAMNSFRTLQRNHNNIQPTIVHSQPTHIQKIFMQNDHAMGQFVNNHSNYAPAQQSNHNNLMNSNPLIDPKANLYEPIDYHGGRMQIGNTVQVDNVNRQQGDMISSSTSSSSMKSPPDASSSNPNSKYRRGSLNPNGVSENEAHDLRVFTNVHASRPSDASERQRLNGTDNDSQSGLGEEDRDEDLIDETTTFRRQSAPGDEQRTRQLSKRKRKQHRNRLHNNNQQIG